MAARPAGAGCRSAAETVQLSAAIDALGRDGTPEALRARLRYLAGQVKGLRTAARRLSGETMRFADETRDAFGIEWSARPSAAASEARRELETRLPGTGPLHERYAAFRLRHAMPRDVVLPVFQAAIAMCRERVRERITLPDEERVDTDMLDGGGFEARAIYSGAYRTHVVIDPSGSAGFSRALSGWRRTRRIRGITCSMCSPNGSVCVARAGSSGLCIPGSGRTR